jgi:acyl-CoA synthetase (AMP-forming)/AMP-acid ligase II
VGAFENGHTQVVGRLSEMIVTGGENVWPAPVEATILDHPGVADVAVAGRADEEWGERVVAFVVRSTEAPPTLDELRGMVKGRLYAWSAPRELVFVDALPRTAIGKVRRRALLEA